MAAGATEEDLGAAEICPGDVRLGVACRLAPVPPTSKALELKVLKTLATFSPHSSLDVCAPRGFWPM